MRYAVLAYLSAHALGLVAQLQNGGFENAGAFDLTGWTSTPCADVSGSSDVPAGGGTHSVALRASCADVCNYALDSNYILQEIPWVTDGMALHLSWWWNKTNTNPYAIAWFGTVNGGVFNDTFSVAGTMGDWIFYETFIIAAIDPGEVAAIALGGGMSLSNTDTAWFDEVVVEPVAGIDERTQRIAFRPNPAHDELWVDLTEPAIEVIHLDPLGRRSPINTSRFDGRTLHVRLDGFAQGQHVLLLRTTSGMQQVRFMKL